MNAPCRVCHLEGLSVVIDLGLQPCGERLLEPYELGDPEPRQPMRLVFCPHCRILQRTDPTANGIATAASNTSSPTELAETGSLKHFLSGLKATLDPQGAASVQLPHVAELAAGRLFEILHPRHSLLLSVDGLQEQLHQHDLEAFQIEQCPADSGQLRVFIGHRGVFPVGDSVSHRIQSEQTMGLGTWAFWEAFGQRVAAFREQLLHEIREIRGAGQRLCGYGASPSGSLLLNFCSLGRDGFDAIDFVLDPSGSGRGRITPGSHLAILPVEELEKRFIKVVLILDPNLAAEAERQTDTWRQQGGRILNPWEPSALTRKKVQNV